MFLKSDFVQFFYRSHYKKVVKKHLKGRTFLLEIGSGLGFVKPIAYSCNVDYIGIEPRLSMYSDAVLKYGKEGFINGFFPESIDKIQYDHDLNVLLRKGSILSISVLDEVDDKKSYMQAIYNIASTGTFILINVRNSGFPYRAKKDVITLKGEGVKDLNILEYTELFNESGFDVLEVKSLSRPIFIGFEKGWLKTFFIFFINFFQSIDKSYMVSFYLRKNIKKGR